MKIETIAIKLHKEKDLSSELKKLDEKETTELIKQAIRKSGGGAYTLQTGDTIVQITVEQMIFVNKISSIVTYKYDLEFGENNK